MVFRIELSCLGLAWQAQSSSGAETADSASEDLWPGGSARKRGQAAHSDNEEGGSIDNGRKAAKGREHQVDNHQGGQEQARQPHKNEGTPQAMRVARRHTVHGMTIMLHVTAPPN